MKSCKYRSAEELPPVLNADEVSLFLGISRSQAYELTRRIDFPAFKVGKRILIPREKFLEWIDNQIEEKEDLFYIDPRGIR